MNIPFDIRIGKFHLKGDLEVQEKPTWHNAQAAIYTPPPPRERWNVRLDSVVPSKKIAVIKVVRDNRPDLGLIDCKRLVENTPIGVVRNVTLAAAQALFYSLENVGGISSIWREPACV